VTRAEQLASLWSAGKHDEALAVVRKALAEGAERAELRELEERLSIASLGVMHESAPHAEAAARLLPELSAAAFGQAHRKTWQAWAVLGRYALRHGDLETAEQAAREALAVTEHQRKKDPLLAAQSWSLLGDVHEEAGRIADAERSHREALAALERAGRKGQREAVLPLARLTRLMLEQQRDAEAETFLKRRLSLQYRPGKPNFDDAIAFLHLAEIEGRLARPRDAVEWARKAMRIAERTRGGDHPDTGRMALQLGELCLSLGRPRAALPLLRRALEVLRRTRGERDPDVVMLPAKMAEAERTAAATGPQAGR